MKYNNYTILIYLYFIQKEIYLKIEIDIDGVLTDILLKQIITYSNLPTRFTLSVTEWCEKTNAIGIYSKRGKYGGTYAYKDIAFEFASSISPVFKLYLIKEFERLKELENQNREWDIKIILTKNNYLIRTDAIKNYILPDNYYFKNKEWLKYAEEADILKQPYLIQLQKQIEENPIMKEYQILL